MATYTVNPVRLYRPNTSTGGIQIGSGIIVAPSAMVRSTSGNTITITGISTAWTAGNPGTPTFTVSAGTITAQVINSPTSASLTYTAPGTAQTVTVTDPSTGKTASITIPGSSGGLFTNTFGGGLT